jgi:hypothetical protein
MAMLASYVAGLGLRREWISQTGELPPWNVEQVLSAALHMAWICCAVSRRGAPVTVICWAASLYACYSGLCSLNKAEHSLAYALMLETIPLLLARALFPSPPLAERLARWRRARADISVQLRMSEGLFPWLPVSVVRFFKGPTESPAGTSYRRFLAELADAEIKLRIRLGGLGLPEHLRQTILSSASALVGQAEKSAAGLAIDLERQALNAAAACRDQCEELKDLQPQEKDALAKQCEALFLELVHPARPLPELRARIA